MYEWFDVLKAIATIVILPIIYWIGRLQQQHNDFRIHVAEKYVSKEDHDKDIASLREYIKEGFAGIKESITGLHRRFDKFEDSMRKALDGKEDKKK